MEAKSHLFEPSFCRHEGQAFLPVGMKAGGHITFKNMVFLKRQFGCAYNFFADCALMRPDDVAAKIGRGRGRRSMRSDCR